MIVVSIKKENNLVKHINIKGHAKYADFGKDIVCASFSSILITTINAILKIESDAVLLDDKVSHIDILSESDVVTKLINNMIDLFIELSNDYPKNILIK